jgi:ADP-ribose pyrophosphatase YjhB (NUDIX family)
VPKPGPKAGKAAKGGRNTPRTRAKRVEEISAGGLVRSRDGRQALLIGRHDKRGRTLWSLPKGHIETDETPEEAAIREVREETGIEAVIVRHLGTIDFWFMADGKRIHKTVHHYLMDEVGGVLTAQTAEVDEVEWFDVDRVVTVLAYSDERKLIRNTMEGA